MAINKNHEFEDLNGVKCAVVEKNATQERVDFLQPLLEWNGYTVVVVPSPPPKAAPAPKPAEGEATVETSALNPSPSTLLPSTFTIGVTDVRFNVTNALMGRMLKTKEGKIVTVDFWQQKETVSQDQIPYFSKDEYVHSWK
ncbi:MAG: hypothetical protein KGZ74_11715 [Chitinophagaceae bacterium]|nr:hypothetical protein [Chitinophagaceae bacterium]